MSYATAYNYTVGENTYVKRKAKNLLNADEIQKVKKELNDNAKHYEHTVYINGFGDADQGKFHKLYGDLFTKGKDHTCLNWCTCCVAPQPYSVVPKMTDSKNIPTNAPIFDGKVTKMVTYENKTYIIKIQYDIEKHKFEYVLNGNKIDSKW